MNVTVNGERRTLADGTTVSALVPEGSAGIAVAVNGSVVPRGTHATHRLLDEDVVEIVTATQGG
jgi:sulfur carrier protein